MVELLTQLGGIFFFFFQAEDGIRDVERSRGLGDVYKRQAKQQNYSVNGVRTIITQNKLIDAN